MTEEKKRGAEFYTEDPYVRGLEDECEQLRQKLIRAEQKIAQEQREKESGLQFLLEEAG